MHGTSVPLEGGAQAPPLSISDLSENSDPLLLCLVQLATLFERPTAVSILTAGLPVSEDGLSLEHFIRAAERVGLRADWVRFDAGAPVETDFPAVAWVQEGAPVLLRSLTPDRRHAEIYAPRQHITSTVPVEALKGIDGGDILRFSPNLTATDPAGEETLDVDKNWLWAAIRPHWRSYFEAFFASAFVNLLALVGPLFTMNVYDRVLPNKAISTLWVLAIGAATALIFDVLLRSARAFLVDHMARQLDIRISSLLIERIMNTTLQANTPTTGITVQRISEYEFLREFIGSNTVIYFVDFVFAFIFLGVILAISPYLALFPVFAIASLVLLGFVVQRLIAAEIGKADQSSSHRQSLMVEIVAGLETIKAVRAEGIFLRRWRDITTVATNTTHRIKNYAAFAANLSYLLQNIVTVVTIVVGAYLFDLGMITTGGIIASAMLGSRAIAPLAQIALMLSRVRQAVSAYHSLDAIMKLPDERSDKRMLVSRVIERGDIEFRAANFTYAGQVRPVLNGINIKIHPGERVAILGRIGAGKTTVGRLLGRLYEVDSGELLIDGVDIRQYHPQEIRSAISVVTHDTHVFNGSVRQNLRLSNPNASDAELLEVARLSGLADFVQAHPAGFERQVGERGQQLSSGQRQILGLARALLSPGRIIFLDDPTSSMDTATERQFVTRFKEGLRPDQTLIVTTHRNAVLALVSRVIVVDGGRVVADGPVEKILRLLNEKAGGV
ncbi:ATP-binding cassette subfamily C protein LapB [Bosea sp. AK1]|nr:ATP-binding cassette subfamily C protein LapB [Bosea sp. AK1]